ncbi:MAG: LysR family transcriptional regulator [Sphingomonas sp.]|nr:LysR family transcriptional regulator [Sphingomonas sp.]
MSIFVAVARQGSFRASAEKLGLSQVVVSTHIRELERDLGTSLFERRSGHPAALTEAGHHALNRISAILAEVADLRQELAGEQSSRQLHLTTYGFVMLRLQERLEAFRDTRPNITLTIHLDPPDNATLASQVQRGDVDLACFFAMEEDKIENSEFLWSEQLAVYVGVDHPLAGKRGVTSEELVAHEAIVLARHNPQRRLTEHALSLVGMAPRRILMETDALALMLANVRRGRAWFCLFRDSIDEAISGLVQVDLATPLSPVEVRLLSRPSLRHDTNLRALRDCFRRV